MSDRKTGRRKTATSTSTNPSLVSPGIPTLANPTRGFGVETNKVQRPIISTDLEEEDLLDEESSEATFTQQPLNHDISKISLHSQDTFSNQPGESHQQQVGMMAAPAVQQKVTPEPVETKQASNYPMQQKPIQRDGMNIPGGATIETVNGNTSAVISLLDQKAIIALDNMPGARPPDFSRYIDRIDQVLSDTSLSDTNIPIDFVETTGVNVYWRGYIRFRLGEPQPLSGGGSAGTTRGFGGSTTSSTETSTSTTDSAKATASGGSTSGTKSGDPTKGGETSTGGSGSVGGEASTTTSRSDKFTDGTTSSRGGTTNMTNNMQRFMAPLIAEISLNPELDVQGSDYVNPLKWGMFIGEGIRPMKRVSGTVSCGNVTYYTSNGITPTPTPTPAAPPAQRKGWMENQLGITEQSQANFSNAAAANNVNPLQLSNSGSTPLPPDVAVAAQQHHAVSLDKVHLVQGGQADAYCDSMSAAAFTTPSHEGGTNIFMHSQVPLDSPQGQHTLSHEVSHAVQQMHGETAELDGLGGNQSRRDALEKSADSHADIIVNKSAQLQKLKQSE
ncbi:MULTISPECIES: DUF4157 domain-containing protein [Nostoc]|uniref:DUF4157 domain-containing protein n=1 Tax=Nostoc paludosum FACHB-159 TaxID=2692908 RepID=A0ABR8KGZ8_9NOSO|nr:MULTISPECIES: DUF4157 domain-containing protein [Nostoc]MBD2680986.1 DUF4157 domain-containing protein [Nostoc sp. FACHB-857]MBD2737468.1 DUF4157 domain-containing protein [Nostoc paludosum FACHB-159]